MPAKKSSKVAGEATPAPTTKAADWQSFSAKTVDDAIAAAAADLGVETGALDVEILEEPGAGLFGRTRGDARIRARSAGKKAGKVVNKVVATPMTPPPAASRADRAPRPKASQSALAAVSAAAAAPARPTRPTRSDRPTRGDRPQRDSRPAAPRGPRPPRVNDEPVDVDAVVASGTRFLQGLLNAADLDGTISHRVVDDQTVEMALNGDSLSMLVGPKGATLLAAQELLRTFVHHDTGGRSGRLMLDVASYREKRRVALVAFTKQVAASVVETGERRVLEPMTAVDRKVVHDAVGDIDGVSSISEGEDPNRYVVLLPA
jgi:spoIIIJ-associated protein